MRLNELRDFLSLISPDAQLEATEARADEWGNLCLLRVDHRPLMSRAQLLSSLKNLPLREHAEVSFGYHDPINWEDEDGCGPEDEALEVRYIYYSVDAGAFSFATFS